MSTYEDQLDPELLERIEAWRAEQARAHELVDNGDDVDPEVLALFEEAEAGNYGRVATWSEGKDVGSSFADDGRLVGERYRRAPAVRKRALGEHAAVVRDFLIEGGWSVPWREPTGGTPGRPRAVNGHASTAELLARVRAEVGFGLDDFERLAGGSRVRRDPAERARLAAAIAEVASRAHGDGAVKLLALAYDCHPRTIQRLCREGGQST